MPERLARPDAAPAIPAFALYGEANHEAALRFLHVESLAARNRLHRWDIRPHRHVDLHQLLFVRQGSGVATLDNRTEPVQAPALISVPALMVHGFRLDPASQGCVITIADSFRDDLVRMTGDHAIAEALRQPMSAQLREADAVTVMPAFDSIADEIVHDRIGRETVVAANLLVAFAVLARVSASLAKMHHRERSGERLFEAFRRAVERDFRQQHTVDRYADLLKTTRRTLHRSCRQMAGRAPQELIHARILLEAKRNLLYTSMSIAEIGYMLGFEEPSYFTRFFRARCDRSPTAFRRQP